MACFLCALAHFVQAQDELEKLARRHVDTPEDAGIRKQLLEYGRRALPALLRAARERRAKLDREFLYRLKFAREKRESNLAVKKKAEETRLDLVLDNRPLLMALHAVTARAAAADR